VCASAEGDPVWVGMCGVGSPVGVGRGMLGIFLGLVSFTYIMIYWPSTFWFFAAIWD